MSSHTARVAPEEAVFRPALPLCPLPGMTEMHMGRMTYREQLLHPNWQKRRLDRLNAAQWTCSRCEIDDKTLHVHHKRYFKGRMAWEYDDAELEVLCEDCHKAAHDHEEVLSQLLTQIDFGYPAHAVAIGLLAGFAAAAGDLREGGLLDAGRAIGGPYFLDGLIGGSAGMGNAAELAAFIRQAYEGPGFPIPAALATELARWARMVRNKEL